MSELTDALAREERRPQTVAEWFELQEDEDQSAIVETILSRSVPVAGLHRVLRSLDDPFPFGLTALKDFANHIRRTM